MILKSVPTYSAVSDWLNLEYSDMYLQNKVKLGKAIPVTGHEGS
jgi:hypothetical protein